MLKRPRIFVFSFKRHRNCNLFYIWGWLQTSKSGQNRVVGKSATEEANTPQLPAHLGRCDSQLPEQGISRRHEAPLVGLGRGLFLFFGNAGIFPLGAFLVLSRFSGNSRNSCMFEGKCLRYLVSLKSRFRFRERVYLDWLSPNQLYSSSAKGFPQTSKCL